MRIRSIKPEFWTSDDIVALPWDVRLLFIGLWSYVADSGVGRDNDKLIAADLFPLEEDPIATLATVSRGLASLSAAGLITRYSVKGKRYLHINAWADHQKIDRPTRSPFPPPTCDDAVIAPALDESSRATREASPPGSRDLGNKGSREQGNEGSSSDKSDNTPAIPDRFEEFWTVYAYKRKRVDAERAWAKAIRKADPDHIIVAAANYADSIRADKAARGDRAPDQAHAASWLNGERWNDDLGDRPNQRVGAAQGWLQLAADLGEPTPPENVREIGPRR